MPNVDKLFFWVPKSTNTEAVTAVDAKEKLTDEGDEEVQTESHPSQASKESATSENVQVHPVIITVIGDIVPNPPINNEQNKIGCSLISYKGYLLNINKIQNKVGKEIISVYSEKIGSRKRQLAKCNICSQFEEQAKKRSRHGIVYIAHGVRCDSEEKLKNIIDHLHSEIHQAALDAKKYKELWDSQDLNHPLVRVLKKQEQTTVENLIKLAIDVYNDSKLLTPSAWSWPARALATAHADQLISSLNENGLQSPFVPLEPSSTDLHYRNPNTYKEMLTTIAELEKVKLKEEVNTAIRFSTQIDGSVDTMQRDNKFLFLKYNSPDDPLEIKTRFVGVTDSDLKGAAGLEDCVLTGLKTIEVDKLVMKKKFAGVTTDGESANTGCKSGL